MTTIAIIGPGAIGGILAAWIGQDPDHAVTVCARTPFDRLEVETPTGRITASPRVVTDPSDPLYGKRMVRAVINTPQGFVTGLHVFVNLSDATVSVQQQ